MVQQLMMLLRAQVLVQLQASLRAAFIGYSKLASDATLRHHFWVGK